MMIPKWMIWQLCVITWQPECLTQLHTPLQSPARAPHVLLCNNIITRKSIKILFASKYFICILACPVGLLRYCTSRKNIQLYYAWMSNKLYHVTGVFLPSQSAHEKHNRENEAHKPLRTSWISQKNVSSMFDNHTILLFYYGINKPFTYSLCMICVSCSVHLISMYYPCKGSQAFLS